MKNWIKKNEDRFRKIYVFQDFMGDDWNRLRQGKGWIWFQFSSWRRALGITNVLMILHLQSNSTLERVALRCKLNVRKHQDTAGFQQQMRLLPRNEVTKIVNFHMYIIVISSESNKSVAVRHKVQGDTNIGYFWKNWIRGPYFTLLLRTPWILQQQTSCFTTTSWQLENSFQKIMWGPYITRKNRGPSGVRGVRRRTPGVRRITGPHVSENCVTCALGGRSA